MSNSLKMKRNHSPLSFSIYLGVVVFLCVRCMPGIHREISRDGIPPIDPKDSSQYIKAHMTDGSLYLLNRLYIHDTGNLIKAKGRFFDRNRKMVAGSADSLFTIDLKNVALFETNNVTGLVGKIGLQTLAMIPAAAITIYCAINPKACFGSCPTFYAWDGTKMRLMTEGFSSSIARAFEESDIDMLHSTVINGREYRIQLTNEALETHAIKFADLLVFPRKDKERIYATPSGVFYSSHTVIQPSSCIAPEGDCTEKMAAMDQSERFSTADPNDLTSKETIEITFRNVPDGETGLIIGSRQTLLTTFLFYQGIPP